MRTDATMKGLVAGCVVLVALILAVCRMDFHHGVGRELPPMEVYFSPHGGCAEAVVGEIEAARKEILVQAYSFTSAPIAKALVDAQRRGVRVKVILDRSQRTEKYSEADFLQHNDIPTLIDAEHAIAHNKIMILDQCIVLTGSFNFTKAAEEHNAENLLVINDPVLAAEFTDNWQAHERHSTPYERQSVSRLSHSRAD